MPEESLAEFYFDKISKSDNPTPFFVEFFTSLFGSVDKKSLYTVFGKLFKVYGKDVVYFSILDCYDIDKLDVKNPYPILAYFCKKRLKSKVTFNVLPSLDNFFGSKGKSKALVVPIMDDN